MILRSRRHHDIDEVPEYWITYSDLMVSLLMAFALLLFIALGREQARIQSAKDQLDERGKLVSAAANALDSSQRSFVFDTATGTISMNASVLFAFGSSNLELAARDDIKALTGVYLPALLSEPIVDSLLQEIVIEGHTDTVGTYLSNLQLSQQRAFSVMQAVLEESRDSRWAGRLRELITASGRSEVQPVYANGEILASRSRRIEVRLRFRDEAVLRSLVGGAKPAGVR